MAASRTLKGLLRLRRAQFKRNKKLIKRTAVVGGAAGIGGGLAGANLAEPGGESAAFKQQAIKQAIVGATAAVVGTVVFRRIRGRIIPIRVKKVK